MVAIRKAAEGPRSGSAFHAAAMALLDTIEVIVQVMNRCGPDFEGIRSKLPELPPHLLEVVNGYQKAREAASMIDAVMRDQRLLDLMPERLTPQLQRFDARLGARLDKLARLKKLDAETSSPGVTAWRLRKMQKRANTLLRRAMATEVSRRDEIHAEQAAISAKERTLVAEWREQALPGLIKQRDDYAAFFAELRPALGRLGGYHCGGRFERAASACEFLRLVANAFVEGKSILRTHVDDRLDFGELRRDVEGEIGELVRSSALPPNVPSRPSRTNPEIDALAHDLLCTAWDNPDPQLQHCPTQRMLAEAVHKKLTDEGRTLKLSTVLQAIKSRCPNSKKKWDEIQMEKEQRARHAVERLQAKTKLKLPIAE